MFIYIYTNYISIAMNWHTNDQINLQWKLIEESPMQIQLTPLTLNTKTFIC